MTMYFIALVLPADLDQKVLHWKNLMHDRYHCKVGLKSPAHITLIPPFWMEEDRQALLLADVDSIAGSMSPFIIKTKNFSAFKPRTIFIDVEKTKELDNLKQNADNFFRNNSAYKMKMDVKSFHPHITIATRDLFKKSFYECWPIFEMEEFLKEWEANGLGVLRHNKKNWDVIHTSQFTK